MNPNETQRNASETTLESWKEIAAYLQRNAVTVRRWEKEEGLPIHRHGHKRGSSVYAYPAEIDAWRAGRKVVPEPVTRPLWKIPAFALTMLLCLVMVGNGARPVSAQQSKQTARQVWTPGSDAAVFGRPSSDGRYLPFRDNKTGDLALRDLVVGTSRRLTSTVAWKEYFHGDAIISPDDRSVAYRWVGANGEYEMRILPIAAAEARSPRILIRGYVAAQAWTPDSKRLLITRSSADGTNQLALISIADGSINVLKSSDWRYPDARFSPDGRYIAYSLPAGDKEPARDIFVLATDGSHETALVQNPANDSSPVWSPDGAQILFVSDRTGINSLWSIPVSAGRPAGPAKLVRANLGSSQPLGFTPGGTLYYATQQNFSNVYSVEMGPSRKVLKPPALLSERYFGSNRGAGWSRDGKYLAYLSTRESRKAVLVIRTLASGEERDVPLGLELAGGVSAPVQWFPDGRSVLVVAEARPRPAFGYYRVDIASGKADLLHSTRARSNFSMQPDLAPDGRTIFYVDADDETSKLFRFDLESRRETVLKVLEGNSLAVSPDGTQLAYATGAPGQRSIEVMPASGGDSRVVFRGEIHRFWGLAWSKDQHDLLMLRLEGSPDNERTILAWIPVAGGAPMDLEIPLNLIRFPQVHPDGHRIVFESSEVSSELWALENFLPQSIAK